MLLGAVQLSPEVGNFEKNYSKIKGYIEEAGDLGIDLLLFPELALSGYTMDEKILSSGWDFLKDRIGDLIRLSREYDMAIVFGTPRKVGGRLRNSVIVIVKKREVLFYDKTHLFRSEKDVFEPGQDFLVFKFKGVHFGISVCYETGFPEISRVLALRGARVILSPFAFGRTRWNIYDVATRSRAIENGAFLVASSTCGEGFMDFVGHSRIVHPSGKILAELPEGEGLISAEIDPSEVYRYRYVEEGDSHAYFSNRKPNMYREILRSENHEKTFVHPLQGKGSREF